MIQCNLKKIEEVALIVQQASLRKILCLLCSNERQRRSILKTDIRESRQPPDPDGGGGDFHTAFWADAKAYARGEVDLEEATAARIQANRRSRSRLYPLLSQGFLRLALEERRLRNENYRVIDLSPKGVLFVEGLAGRIKVQDTLQIEIEGVGPRTVYPYFADEPALSADVARLGVWAMSRALDRAIDEMRLIDVIRSTTYGTRNLALQGNEEAEFSRRYIDLIAEWHRLADE